MQPLGSLGIGSKDAKRSGDKSAHSAGGSRTAGGSRSQGSSRVGTSVLYDARQIFPEFRPTSIDPY